MRFHKRKITILLIITTVLYFFLAFFALQQVKIPSPLYPRSYVDLLEVFIYVTIFFIPVAVVIVYKLFVYEVKIAEKKADERVESYVTGGIKEKILHRELKSWEQFFLEEKYKSTKNQDYDLDRRSPVFKIQGKLVKLDRTGNKTLSVKEEWSVRGLTLNEINYPDIRVKHFREGEDLVVEFSPYSKWVWDVYKVVGRHRNWFMYLDPEIFDQVLAGKIKVIGRAPFGRHDLAEIKSGDIITFTHLKTGRRVDTKIQKIRRYSRVEDMANSEGAENILLGANSDEEIVSFHHALYNYKERIAKGGIYAFRVSLFNSDKNL